MTSLPPVENRIAEGFKLSSRLDNSLSVGLATRPNLSLGDNIGMKTASRILIDAMQAPLIAYLRMRSALGLPITLLVV